MNDQEIESMFVADAIPGDGPTFSNPDLIHESGTTGIRVYRASRSGRVFVLKALVPQRAADPMMRAMLRKEFNAAFGLSHPGIATVFSFETVKGIGECIVEEYIDGENLDHFITSHHLSPREKLEMMLQLTDAIGYLHARQMIHRDLKPANIMVTSTGNSVKIVDFGMADSPGLSTMKGTGGTDGFAAPEQYETGATVDHRADIYAFGRILDALGIFPATARRCHAADPSFRPADIRQVSRFLRREYTRQQLKRPLAATAVLAAVATISVLTWQYYPEMSKREATDTASATSSQSAVSPPALPGGYDSLPPLSPGIAASLPSVSPLQQTVADIIPHSGRYIDNGDTIIPISEMLPDPEPEVAGEVPHIADNSRPYSERLRSAALAAAERRFAAHIASADTITSHDGFRRFQIGYWRHLAKQDLKAWWRANPDPAYPYEAEAIAPGIELIDAYSAAHEKKDIEASRKLDRRIGIDHVVINRYVADEHPDGTLDVYILGEDDKWHFSTETPASPSH